MTNVFTAVYLADRDRVRPTSTDPVAQAFFAATASTAPDDFPYDGSDDPAFFSARHLDGPVSWGVCRTDVRNLAEPGDWVALFARERTGEPNGSQYRFVAALRVAAKHSGWNPPEPFDRYLNRLVVRDPDVGAWKHEEPSITEKEWHHDWMWRLSTGPQGRKDSFEELGKAGTASASHVAGDHGDGKNYVVFDRSPGLIMEDPPVVAHCSGTRKQETWDSDPRVLALRNAVFGGGHHRHYLRTTNQYQPHRHTRTTVVDPDGWFAKVQTAAARL